jgi:dephospho-CoA kinase
LPIDEKARLGDYVIRTDGTFAATDAQVANVHARLVERSRADQ